MASDCNPTINSNDSSSYFQQTVCLQDWWLIKSEKAFQGKRLAVAGFSSKEQRAVRVFSSAPIIKRYDLFTLETADGINVVIKGFINKLRTNENGFPYEAFNHFLFGFPPHWEEYAEKCFEADSTGVFVSRSMAGIVSISTLDLDKLMMDSEKTSNQCEKTINEARHENCEDVAEMNLGLESSGNLKEQSKLHHNACNESPDIVGKECQQNNVADSVICGQEELSFDIGSLVSSTTMVEKDSSENVGHPSSLQNPRGASSSSVCGVGLEVTEREYSVMAQVDGNPKPLQPYGCTHDTLKHPTLMSGSEVNTVTVCKIEMDRLCNTLRNTRSRTCNSLKNLKGKQKDNLASKCNMKHKNNEKSFSPFEWCENQDEGNMNRSSSATSTRSGKKKVISEEIPCQSDGEVSKCQSWKSNSKRQEGQIAEVGLKNKRKRLTSIPVGFDNVNNTVENISHEIGGESISNLSDVGLQEHHNITVEKLDDKCSTDGSQQNSKFPPAYTDAKCKQNHENILNKAGIHSKNTNESLRLSTRLGKANQKVDLKTAVERASSSGKKTKRKLDYNTQVTHPSIKEETKASIVSPDLSSLKRSRSGRLLLPSLDFWRNQMAVYDADRRITGIQEGLHVVKPSRGSRSEPQRRKRPLK